MINYAHRGASEYAPENTLSSFYLGLMQGANGIETDVQRTKDGHLVLFHDDTVDRVTDGKGNLCDFTLEELKNLKVYGNNTTDFYDRVVTFREFLEKFSCYDITFAIELKGPGVEEDSLNMIKEFGIMDKTIFTSFKFDYIKKIKELDKSAKVGWLMFADEENATEKLLSIGGEEMCPMAEKVTPELMKEWRNAGLNVRAWGVTNIPIMKNMCDAGVDGMTVNFPDLLIKYIKSTT